LKTPFIASHPHQHWSHTII